MPLGNLFSIETSSDRAEEIRLVRYARHAPHSNRSRGGRKQVKIFFGSLRYVEFTVWQRLADFASSLIGDRRALNS
jgi:hypothetical protein